MSHIKPEELMNTMDVFFVQLFGEENYMRWQELKLQLRFESEKKFVTWILNYVTANYDLDKLIDEANDDVFVAGKIQKKLEEPSSDSPPSKQENLIEEDVDKNSMANGLVDVSPGGVKEELEEVIKPSPPPLITTFPTLPISIEDDDTQMLFLHDPQQTGMFLNDEDVSNDNDVPLSIDEGGDVIGGANPRVLNLDVSPGPDFMSMVGGGGGGGDKSPFRCSECGKFFRYRGDMLRHHKEIHLNIKKYECRHCGRFFSRSYILRKHIEAIHDPNFLSDLKKYSCPLCSSKFTAKTNYTIHMNRCHPYYELVK